MKLGGIRECHPSLRFIFPAFCLSELNDGAVVMEKGVCRRRRRRLCMVVFYSIITLG